MTHAVATPPGAPPAGALVLRDGLELHAPGGLYVPAERALVVADTHVGYTATLRKRGYAVPASPDAELIARVLAMLDATRAERVIVAGDLVHGPGSVVGDPSPLACFVRAIAPRAIVAVLGNHDRRSARALAALGVAGADALTLGPHLVHHGDVPERVREERVRARARGGRVIVGHLHPALTLDGGAGARATVPAFVTASGLACLPALAPQARGGDVRSYSLRAQLGELVGRDEMGVAAVVGASVIAVGNVFRSTA